MPSSDWSVSICRRHGDSNIMVPCRDTCALERPRLESQVDSARQTWLHEIIFTWCNEPADNLTDWCLIPHMQCIAKKLITYTKSFNDISKGSDVSGMHLFQRAHVCYRLQMNVSTSNNYFLPFTDLAFEDNNQHIHRSCPSIINLLYNWVVRQNNLDPQWTTLSKDIWNAHQLNNFEISYRCLI